MIYKNQRTSERASKKVISAQDIEDAAIRIEGVVPVTPIFSSTYMNDHTGFNCLFKHEGLNKTGSFKARGACNAVKMLSDEQAAKGVVTHSSGNFAQALSWAANNARANPIPGYIVMPDNAPASKRAATIGYGGIVSLCESTQEGREAAAAAIVREKEAELIHPYNDPRVMAGQGTMALEILEAHPDVEMIVVPVGGGGMISGIATVAKARNPDILVIGAEPEMASDAARSLESDILQRNDSYPDTIADGLRVNLGDNDFECIRQHVDAIVTVTEKQISDACFAVFSRMKLVIEPSAGVGVAALLNFSAELRREFGLSENAKVACILCGSNIDLTKKLPWN